MSIELSSDAYLQNVIKPQYMKLTDRILKFEDRRADDLDWSLGRGHHGVVAVLQNTVKDHKPVGMVSCRPIHACTNFAFEGLAEWVHQQLHTRLVA